MAFRSLRLSVPLTFTLLGACAVACGGTFKDGGDLEVTPEDDAGGGGGPGGGGPGGGPTTGDADGGGLPVAFKVHDPVVISESEFLPRGITPAGDVIVERDDGNGKKSAHAIPVAGGAPTEIESNLDASDAEITVYGNVVAIRKKPPSARTSEITVWSRPTGLSNLGNTIRHYGSFAASDDGKLVAHATEKEIKMGPIGNLKTVANNIDAGSEDCLPNIEFVGSLLVTSTCAGGSKGGDLRTFDGAGKETKIAGAGTLGYNGFGFGGTNTHVLFDTGGIGASLHLVDLAAGTETKIDDAGHYSGAVLSPDAKTAVYESSSRSEIRKWAGGKSTQLVNRITFFRSASDASWIAGTTSLSKPYKLLAVEVATGKADEIADDGYASRFAGDNSGIFYAKNNNSTHFFYDLATKQSQQVGTGTVNTLPGRSELFFIDCPDGSSYDSAVCTLNATDVKSFSMAKLDETVSKRFYIEGHTIAYVKGTSIVTRTVDY